MNLFGPRQVAGVPDVTALLKRQGELEAALTECRSAIRGLELEQENMHKQVRTWMRKAVAAERRTEAPPQVSYQPTIALPSVPSVLTGVRARRYVNQMRASGEGGSVRSTPPSGEPEYNGHEVEG